MEISPTVVKISITVTMSILSAVYMMWALCQGDVPDWYKALCAAVLFILPPVIFTSVTVLVWMYL